MSIEDSFDYNQTLTGLGKIDQYEILQELGGGGFGSVYLARDTTSRVLVAIKGLPPSVKNDNEDMENIRNNFTIVHDLHHPHIAAALVLHRANKVCYSKEEVRQKLRVLEGDPLLVMAYAPGVTLSKWRRQFPKNIVPTDQAIEIVKQIASALDYAHAEKVLHRDVKPANVMIETKADGSITARVLDFGLAAEIRSSLGRSAGQVHDTSGTRPYMAPEQWIGARQSSATDQYALAAMFYELITGEVPFASVFQTGDAIVMMNVVRGQNFVPPPDMPKNTAKALSKALSKDIDQRFPCCMDFVKALQGDFATTGRNSRTVVKESKPLPFARIFAAVSIVALALGGAWYGWMRYDQAAKARKLEEERLRGEVYDMQGRASQVRELNQSAVWKNWKHFQFHAKELESSYRAGEMALEKNDFNLAKVQFQKVREYWLLLSSNKADRAQALQKCEVVKVARRTAEKASAGVLASNDFAVAESIERNADELFENGLFNKAIAEYEQANAAFAKALKSAENENKRRIKAKIKADTEAALLAFNANPPRYIEGMKYSATADRENPDLQFHLARCYFHGYGGVAVNKPEAARWYLKSANQGCAEALVPIGLMYEKGDGVALNYAEAVKWYRKAAEKGDCSGENYLGEMYETGDGVAKDIAEAVKWYRKAAEKGFARGQLNLARMYAQGTGVEENQLEAASWFRKAAEQGEAKAQYLLGLMYAEGNAVAKDNKEAVSWFRKAAEQGDASAAFSLAIHCANGRGVDKDLAEAAKWYRKAANVGHAQAQRNLGMAYEEGAGVPKDAVEAFKWYYKSAEQGDKFAQFLVAYSYFKGQGVNENKTEAVKWYLKSAEQGVVSAQRNLGILYFEGQGVDKNYSEAVKWSRKAAEKGDAVSQSNLGWAYEHGNGIEQDYAEAAKWYRKAAEQGNGTAQCNLGDLYEKGKGVDKNMAEAMAWYQKAAKNGSVRAKERLSEFTSASDVDKRCREGITMLGLEPDNDSFRNGQTIYISPGDNAKEKIENSPDWATILFDKGEYDLGWFKLKGNKRIRGKGIGKTIIKGRINSGNGGSYLIAMDATFVIDSSTSGKYPIWVDEYGKAVIKNCGLIGGGIWASDGSKCVVSRTNVKDAYGRGISMGDNSKVYVADSKLNAANDKSAVLHGGARVVMKNTQLSTQKQDESVCYFGFENTAFYLENCILTGDDRGIAIGNGASGCLKNVTFQRCKDSIENYGDIELFGNTYHGNKFSSSSKGKYINKENGNFDVNPNFFK